MARCMTGWSRSCEPKPARDDQPRRTGRRAGMSTHPPTSQACSPCASPLWGSRLIEASAGTGKTWTIAALYLRLVLGHGAEQRL